MRALVQRVSQSEVKVDKEVVGGIKNGLCIFIGIAELDDDKDINYLVDKIVNLRIFSNPEGKFDLSAVDINAELLVISQFTLYANTNKGRRPSFIRSANPEKAKTLFKDVINRFKGTGLKVETGKFQHHMNVSLINDGPVTIFIDSNNTEI
ncbi:MAG: D-tyrosyl-tRNA(Tyr) deacylase [Dehalococcoidia bacterium]|nr:D-tyrosyl-tRNA(Tyr) deacylase [Dehalococcoidia bacterium]MQG16142.1 D-tyrosyl-tRNA(Tyr) deacylase [SAR202 cluster bacterium]